MTPIYATQRADLSQWWAYKVPEGRSAIWDGGIHDRTDITGLWCPVTGNKIDAPDSLLRDLPATCLYGMVDGDHFHVTGFPHIRTLLHMFPLCPYEPKLAYPETKVLRATFLDEFMAAPELLPDCCSFVTPTTLPDHKIDALDALNDLGEQYVARHPSASWTVERSCLLASIVQPETVRQARVREISLDNDLDIVDFITAWSTVECLETFYPLYMHDDDPYLDIWKPKTRVTLYLHAGEVIGYE
ncbi:MAG: hypothetical protein GY906_04825 [bacterium]|nr:hypothetical protein [bacterium]